MGKVFQIGSFSYVIEKIDVFFIDDVTKTDLYICSGSTKFDNSFSSEKSCRAAFDALKEAIEEL